jgi:hypothetical protein
MLSLLLQNGDDQTRQQCDHHANYPLHRHINSVVFLSLSFFPSVSLLLFLYVFNSPFFSLAACVRPSLGAVLPLYT